MAVRKGQFDIPLITIIEVIIIVVGLFAILSIVRTWWQPHKQIAFSNAELLRTAIDDVCAGGGPKTINFNFPQPKPITFGRFGMGPMPKMMIKTSGDPNYLLYYENFPPGEAYHWEIYTIQPVKIVDFLLDKRRFGYWRSDNPFLISNIVLGNESFGNWTDDFFKFSAYALLSDLNKSMIKYRMCGANALCLKTKDGIYRLPLPNCRGRIEGIQLFQDWGMVQDEDEQFDFYLASPCSVGLTIEKTKCGCGEWGGATEQPGEDDTGSGKILPVRVPVFELQGEQLVQTSKTTRCFHRIGKAGEQMAGSEPAYFDCIRIKVVGGKYGDDFCFSSNDVEPAGMLRFGSGDRAIAETSVLSDLSRMGIFGVALAGAGPGKEYLVFKHLGESIFIPGYKGTIEWAWPTGMAFE